MVYASHLREANLCVRGAKQWFRLHNLDFEDFIRHGLPIEKVEATQDALGLKVANIAREEAEEQRK